MPLLFEPGSAARTAQYDKYRKHDDSCVAAGFRFRHFAVDALGVLAPVAKGDERLSGLFSGSSCCSSPISGEARV